jgi:hypothetical protein
LKAESRLLPQQVIVNVPPRNIGEQLDRDEFTQQSMGKMLNLRYNKSVGTYQVDSKLD